MEKEKENKQNQQPTTVQLINFIPPTKVWGHNFDLDFIGPTLHVFD